MVTGVVAGPGVGKEILPQHAAGAVEYVGEAYEGAKDLLGVLGRIASPSARIAALTACDQLLRRVSQLRDLAVEGGARLMSTQQLWDAVRVLSMVSEVERRRAGEVQGEWFAGVDRRCLVPLKALVAAPQGQWAEQATGYQVLNRHLQRLGVLTDGARLVLRPVIDGCKDLAKEDGETIGAVEDLFAILHRVRSPRARVAVLEACGHVLKHLAERGEAVAAVETHLSAGDLKAALPVLRMVWDVERRRAIDTQLPWANMPYPKFVLAVKALVGLPGGDWTAQAEAYRALWRQLGDAGVLNEGAKFVLTPVIYSCDALAVNEHLVR